MPFQHSKAPSSAPPGREPSSVGGAWRIDTAIWEGIEIVGGDRLEWLQGQATNDVKGLTTATGQSFCFCEPNGALLAVVDAWALADRLLLTTARETAASVLDRVERMTILEEVEARPFAGGLVSIQGPRAEAELAELFQLPEGDAGTVRIEDVEAVAARSRRTAWGGWDIWLPFGAEAAASRLDSTFSALSAESFEAARIEAGIPRWGRDMNARTLPPELGPDFEARHVSYRKGCYTGQEVLMRLHSRGHTNRTWRGLVAESPLQVGDPVTFADKPVGTVASAAISASFGPIGAAMLRNEASEGETVLCGEVRAKVHRMPILKGE